MVRGRRGRPMPPHREVFDPRRDSFFRWDDTDVIAEASAPALARRLTRRVLGLVLVIVLIGLLVGAVLASRHAPALRQAEPSDSTAQSLFLSMRTEALRGAAANASPLVREARTVQTSPEGFVVATRDRVTRGGRVLRDTTAGAFDYGLYRAFESSASTTPDPTDLFATVPAALAEVLRTPDAYVFSTRTDTAFGDQPVRLVEARARSGTGDGRNVRRVTAFLDPSAPVAYGLAVERAVLALWYREDVWMQIEAVPRPDGGLTPHRSGFRSRVGMPFEPARPITTTVTYRSATSD